MSGGVLVAGIGNIFLSDDGFGVEVVSRLSDLPLPSGVRVADFGIRGVHLAYELLDGFDTLILIDAVAMGEVPGTVVVIEPERGSALVHDGALDAHSMSPDVVLGTLAHLGGSVEHIYVVGCEPGCLDEGMGLSPAVSPAVEDGVTLCRELIAEVVQLVGKGTVA